MGHKEKWAAVIVGVDGVGYTHTRHRTWLGARRQSRKDRRRLAWLAVHPKMTEYADTLARRTFRVERLPVRGLR